MYFQSQFGHTQPFIFGILLCFAPATIFPAFTAPYRATWELPRATPANQSSAKCLAQGHFDSYRE